jgi:hypothetical protein
MPAGVGGVGKRRACGSARRPYHGNVFPFKSRQELAALPEYERIRYVARMMWVTVALGLGFGLQLAFLEGFRGTGLLIVASTALVLPCAVIFTLRARHIRPR